MLSRPRRIGSVKKRRSRRLGCQRFTSTSVRRCAEKTRNTMKRRSRWLPRIQIGQGEMDRRTRHGLQGVIGQTGHTSLERLGLGLWTIITITQRLWLPLLLRIPILPSLNHSPSRSGSLNRSDSRRVRRRANGRMLSKTCPRLRGSSLRLRCLPTLSIRMRLRLSRGQIRIALQHRSG